MRYSKTNLTSVCFSALTLFGVAGCAYAQDYQYTPQQPYTPQYPQYQQYPANAPPVAPAAQPQVALTPAQIDQLVAPIALYPDPLLAQIFPAATYPQDLAAAQQWLQAYPNVTEDDIQAQNWDPSIKALIHYPTVLQWMTQNMDWTAALGAAFLNQQQDVMASVQRLRAQALADGSLKSTPQQLVINDNGVIQIEPANPDTICVPQYDPNAVYEQPTTIAFSVGIPIGLWLDNDCDWHNHDIIVGCGWFSTWHHPDDWDRHPPQWLRNPPDWYKRRPDWNNRQTQWQRNKPAEVPAAQQWTRAREKPAPRLTAEVVNRAFAAPPHINGVPNRKPLPPLPVKPRPPIPAAEPSKNVFGGYENRSDANQAVERGQQSRQPAAPHVNPPEVHQPSAPPPGRSDHRSAEPAPAPHVSQPAAPPPSAPPAGRNDHRSAEPAPAPAPRAPEHAPAPRAPEPPPHAPAIANHHQRRRRMLPNRSTASRRPAATPMTPAIPVIADMPRITVEGFLNGCCLQTGSKPLDTKIDFQNHEEPIMQNHKMIKLGSFFGTLLLSVALVGLGACSQTKTIQNVDVTPAGQPGAGQQLFATDDAAAAALVDAAKARDHATMDHIFGPASKDLVSGDKVADENAFNRFATHAGEHTTLEKKDANTSILDIGNDNWPFPIPIVKTPNGQWFFDTQSGKQEILDRRIGRNELETIKVCHAYVEAQREYASVDRDNDGVANYAQRMVSHPGKKDGLYWEAAAGEEESPFGSLVAQAAAEGYSTKHEPGTGPHPYHGYIYHVLTRQGPAAPGGKYNYVINGNMIAGFALVAFPIEYGQSGVMTFIVSHQGKVYQKDLGAKTAEFARKIKCYNPDSTWTLVKE